MFRFVYSWSAFRFLEMISWRFLLLASLAKLVLLDMKNSGSLGSCPRKNEARLIVPMLCFSGGALKLCDVEEKGFVGVGIGGY